MSAQRSEKLTQYIKGFRREGETTKRLRHLSHSLYNLVSGNIRGNVLPNNPITSSDSLSVFHLLEDNIRHDAADSDVWQYARATMMNTYASLTMDHSVNPDLKSQIFIRGISVAAEATVKIAIENPEAGRESIGGLMDFMNLILDGSAQAGELSAVKQSTPEIRKNVEISVLQSLRRIAGNASEYDLEKMFGLLNKASHFDDMDYYKKLPWTDQLDYLKNVVAIITRISEHNKGFEAFWPIIDLIKVPNSFSVIVDKYNSLGTSSETKDKIRSKMGPLAQAFFSFNQNDTARVWSSMESMFINLIDSDKNGVSTLAQMYWDDFQYARKHDFILPLTNGNSI